MKRLTILLALVPLALAGCLAGPSYQRPAVAVPDQLYGQSGPSSAASLGDLPWWQVFQDPALKSLVEEALKNGYDVRLALARVEEARARYGVAGSALAPQIGYQADYVRARSSALVAQVPNPPAGNVITANVNFNWEIDLFGRLRNLTAAARAEYLASEEAQRGVRLTLVSEVAMAYLDLRQLDEELEIARRTTAAFQDTFNLFDRRLQGGAASALETSNAEAALAGETAQIPLLESLIVSKENQIDLLLGRGPGPVARGASLADQPVAAEVPVGLPSALLERRPDIREAEQLLRAATSTVGAARASFFPTFSLTGLFGGVSPELSNLLRDNKNWSLGAGLLGPIFQGGRLRAQLRVAQAQLEQAKLQFEQAVTTSLGDVSSALVSLQKLGESQTQRDRAVRANREAVRLSQLRYVSGLSAYFEVITAQQQLLGAENALAQTRRDRLVALVNLYKALGGGWQTAEDPGATIAAAPAPAAAPAVH